MKVGLPQFQARFLEQAPKRVPDPSVREAVDRVTLSKAPPQQAIQQVALAIATAAQGGGVPALAALAQEVARSLVTPEQEQAFADQVLDVFEERRAPADPAVDSTWQRLQMVTDSPYPAPEIIASPLVIAQADSRNLLLGKEALQTELKDPHVLAFTLAHEEGHRQHRDTAGTKGLEALLEAAPEAVAFQAMQEGRHENERQADAFGARAAAKLGCDPVPILKYLLSTAEDREHPGGFERAEAVRGILGATDKEWSELTLAKPGPETYGHYTDDPATWTPLYPTRLDELRERRLDFLKERVQPGSLVVIDQFFNNTAAPTHGRMVVDTARSEGFAGPVLELDTTFSLTPASTDGIEEAEQRFLKAQSPAEGRQGLADFVTLKRSFSLKQAADQLEQLTAAGLEHSAVNISMGYNAADYTRRTLQKAIEGDWMLPLLKAFEADLATFADPRPEVHGPERARVASELCKTLSAPDSRWQEARQCYDQAVEKLEARHNAVVVAAGNEGEIGVFLAAWSAGYPVERPRNFEQNDLSNAHVTVVGVDAPYSSHDPEVDVLADGRAAGYDETGTSFAAPRVAARLLG